MAVVSKSQLIRCGVLPSLFSMLDVDQERKRHKCIGVGASKFPFTTFSTLVLWQEGCTASWGPISACSNWLVFRSLHLIHRMYEYHSPF